MATWIDALARTRNQIGGALKKVFSRKNAADEASLEELEERLLAADVPVRLAAELIEDLEDAGHGDSPHDTLKKDLVNALATDGPYAWSFPEKPHTILVVGINGAGKTTTCAKLAHHAKSRGLQPLLGATDTFRAAGAQQLEIWADRIGCDVVAGAMGGDAAAVAYDTLDAGIARQADVLFIDTAGRMHTKEPLMQEMTKIQRALGKRLEGAPHDTWIVLDASLGQNAVLQAKTFHEAVPLTGVVITKLDGSSKAGFLFSVAKELGVPILFVGLGEGEDDLVPFDADAFVDALLGIEAHVEEM